MPCRSDYMEPSRREREQKEAAQHLAFIYSLRGTNPPAWVAKDAIVELCDTMRALSEQDRDTLLYSDAKDKNRRRLADWWERHLEDDAERERLEKADAERERLRLQAREKLTPEERDAIGLD